MKFTNNFRLLVSLKLEVFLAHLVVGFVIFTVLHLFPWRFHQICRERAARFRNDISYVILCNPDLDGMDILFGHGGNEDVHEKRVSSQQIVVTALI